MLATKTTYDGLARDARVAIQVDRISKSYGSFAAINGVSLSIEAGRIHALLGENGAGKTTLARILAGGIRPTSGRLIVRGSAAEFRNVSDARQVGIGMVPQHLYLPPSLTVAEYVFMEENSGWKMPREEGEDALKSRFEAFGVSLDPRRRLWELAPSERQWLAVFVLSETGSSILILDEPTSLLTDNQGDDLLRRCRDLAEKGAAVVLVSHKMREVREFADHVTVLRRGALVASAAVADLDGNALARLIVGEESTATPGSGGIEIEGTARNRFSGDTSPVLEIKHVAVRGFQGSPKLHDISLEVRRGQILGVVGISGGGQEELAEIAAGIRQHDSGAVDFYGNEGCRRYIPADRLGVGAPARLSISDNLVLRDFWRAPFSRFGFLNRTEIELHARQRAEQFDVRFTSLDNATGSLSGGNVQRVIVARELVGRVDLLVANDPTSGLDIRSADFVRGEICRICDSGAGILLISSDLEEVIRLSDQIVVLYFGRIVGVVSAGEASKSEIGRMMTMGANTVRIGR